jgi:hypothetical protein
LRPIILSFMAIRLRDILVSTSLLEQSMQADFRVYD